MTLIDRLSKLDGPCGHYTAMDMAIHSPFKNKERELFIEALNGSVDAAITLAERVLPGWKKQLLEDYNGKWVARNCSQRRELFSTDYLRGTENGGSPNPAIALCIAILRAKEASNVL